MRVLIVNDDPTQATNFELSLNAARVNPYVVDSTQEAFELSQLYDYDLMLVSLRVYNAADLVSRLRRSRIKTPIVYVTESLDAKLTVELLNAGADDVLQVPMHRDELVARITAIVRRSQGHAAAKIDTGPLSVNLDAKTVTVNGKDVHLTGKEYDMMELLALRKGTTLTKEAFLNHLYGGMDEPEVKIVDVFICKLRKKLAEAGATGLVETVWGRGYVLREPTELQQLQNLVEENA